jgi:hypothetical protein
MQAPPSPRKNTTIEMADSATRAASRTRLAAQDAQI